MSGVKYVLLQTAKKDPQECKMDMMHPLFADNKIQTSYSQSTNKVRLELAQELRGEIDFVLAGYTVHECLVQKVLLTISESG